LDIFTVAHSPELFPSLKAAGYHRTVVRACCLDENQFNKLAKFDQSQKQFAAKGPDYCLNTFGELSGKEGIATITYYNNNFSANKTEISKISITRRTRIASPSFSTTIR
jgi:hypothetical protein